MMLVHPADSSKAITIRGNIILVKRDPQQPRFTVAIHKLRERVY